MIKTADLMKTVTDLANGSTRQALTGRNALIRNLFDFLDRQSHWQSGPLFLCTDYGLILASRFPDSSPDLTGIPLDLTRVREVHKELVFTESPSGYLVISEAAAIAGQIQMSMDALLNIVDTNETFNSHLLRCFDSLQNAISIYDKDARLLFANETFCRFLHIRDRTSAIGMHVHDMMEHYGIKAQPLDSDHLKMMDVLKNGKEELDCGVRLESKLDPSYVQFVDNDMYPIFNQQGEVAGLIEISRSFQQAMKKTRKIMGLTAEYHFKDIIGQSTALREKIRLAKEFSRSSGNVLITGESGVGKELFAQSIHNYSPRCKGPFVALNCASFPAELIESELFGYVEGAFTGASRKGQIGKIELADGGTLFLDEIGELPYYFQSKLLRVLETWMVTRVGSTKEISVSVRLIAATNRNLKEMVSAGLFRQDLYYRLQVLDIEIPPLRERKGDMRLLAEHFLQRSAEQNGTAMKKINKEAVSMLEKYDWPGNARELRNFINRIDLLSKESVITGSLIDTYLNPHEHETATKSDKDEAPEERINKRKIAVDTSYAELLKEVLDITCGNKKAAAELLEVSRKTFYRMLERYNVDI